jgi:hypothetical protein
VSPTSRRWYLVPNAHPRLTINLKEIRTRNEAARRVLAEASATMPTLAGNGQLLEDALSDVAALADEVTRLSAELAAARLGQANLLAAGRATLAACGEDESDPMSYLRDELDAQGFGTVRRPA